jgi:hypothetical protein
VDEDVVLKAGVVGPRQQIYKPGLRSTAIHGGDYVQDADGAIPRAGTGRRGSKDFDRLYHLRTPERSCTNR